MNTPLATIQSVYQRFSEGDVPGILALLREDVEWEHDTIDHGIPWIRPGRGHAHAVRFFETLAGLEFHAFVPEAFLTDNTHVAVFVRHDVTNRATGRRFAGVELHYWTVDAEGRVARLKHFVDTLQHKAAATP